jgi:hypothetical protein
VKEHRPSHYLDVECDSTQVAEFGPHMKDLTNQHITSFAGGHGALMKLEKHKLDNIGYIKSFSGIHNNPERLRRLTHRLEFAYSLASIANAEAQDTAFVKDSVSSRYNTTGTGSQ